MERQNMGHPKIATLNPLLWADPVGLGILSKPNDKEAFVEELLYTHC